MTPTPSRVGRIPRRLPNARMPGERANWRAGGIVSVLAHLLALALLIWPIALSHGDITPFEQGSGGAGPAGGGGGSSAGDAMHRELLRFVRVAPVPPAAAMPQPVIAVPAPLPTPVPIVRDPEPVIPAAPATPASTGGDQESGGGAGPGSGGGVGSGVGTGKGSGVGPGTGGGTQENHPPTPDVIFIPPTPIPESVRGFHLLAEFDVDESGRVLSLDFTPTSDRGYNRRLAEVFRGFHFRPGTRPDGTPIRMKFQMAVDF